MNKTSLMRLSAVILLMLLAVLVLQNKDDEISSGKVFVPELGPNIDSIRIVELNNGTDQLRIEQNVSGDWLLAQAQNYFVDTGRLAEFLRTMASAKTVEEKTSKPEYYERLGVNEVSPDGDTVKVLLDWDTGKTEVLLGDIQGSSRYARQPDQVTAWLLDSDFNLSLDASAWLNDELIDIDASDVLEASIVHSSGDAVKIIRDDDGVYSLDELPEGRTLKYASILDSIGSSLSGLTFEQVRAQKNDLQQIDTLAETVATFGLSGGANIVVSRFVDDSDSEASWFRLEWKSAAQPSSIFTEAELEAFRRAVDGWEFQFASFKADQFAQNMENLLAPQE